VPGASEPLSAGELVGAEREQDGGGDAATSRQLVAAQQSQQPVAQRVVAPLPSAAPVRFAVFGGGGSGEGVQDGEQRLGADRVQLSADLSRSVGALPDAQVTAAVPVTFGAERAVGVEGVEQSSGDHPQRPRTVLAGLRDEERLDGGVVLGGDGGRELVDRLGDHPRVRP